MSITIEDWRTDFLTTRYIVDLIDFCDTVEESFPVLVRGIAASDLWKALAVCGPNCGVVNILSDYHDGDHFAAVLEKVSGKYQLTTSVKG